jgi:glycogen synthase
MQLLFLSNLYPPYALGGYEQWCQEVAIALAERGHTVDVLTARVGAAAPHSQEDGVTVHRQLHLEVTGGLSQTAFRLLFNRTRLEAANLRTVRSLITATQPDAALIWGMWNVPHTVPALVEELMPGRVVYYLCDYWLTLPNAYIQRWHEPARSHWRALQWTKQRLGDYFLTRLTAEPAIPLRLEQPICVSRAVRKLLVANGAPVAHGQIVYGGTQVKQFLANSIHQDEQPDPVLRLLYVGRLVADKGVHDVLTALQHLKNDHNGSTVTLDVYGEGDPDYTTSLLTYVQEHKLERQVTFHGSVPRANIPAILAQHDVLLFPSVWPEPFARTVLEAMAAGLAVIGTTTGGTGEILQHGQTGLTYPAGNAQALAEQIAQLAHDPAGRIRLARAGQARVMAEFTFERMVDELEATLNGR